MRGESFTKGVPVVCDSCGFKGRVPGIIGGNATGITLVGNRVSCPRCPAFARTVDGKYDLDEDIFHWKSGPPAAWQEFAEILSDERWTPKRVERVREVLASSVDETEPELVVERVRRIDKPFAAWLKRTLRHPLVKKVGKNVLLPVVIGVLTNLSSDYLKKDEPPPPPEVIVKIVERVVELPENQSRIPERSQPPRTPPKPTSNDRRW